MMYEDSLKIAVQMLSRATPASELVKLLKLTSYLDRQDVSHKLIDYLNHSQKVTHLDNSELADLYSSLVLTTFQGERKKMASFMQMIEYLLLRRVHALNPKEIMKVVYSYCHLIRQNKIVGSTSVLKTMEYAVTSKWLDFDNS